MQVSVIIPAAGHGERFNQGRAGPGKIEWPLAGKPVLMHAADLFLHRDDVSQVLIAVPPDQLEHFQSTYGDRLGWLGGRIVAGGTTARWDTVRVALDSVDADCTHIAVHDAARPLTSQALIDRVFAAVRHYHAAIPAVDVANTLKRIEPTSDEEKADPHGAARSPHEPADPLDALLGQGGASQPPAVRRVVETVSRHNLRAAQTPQVFEAQLLHRAYAPLKESPSSDMAGSVTDDASLLEALGEAVYTTAGEATNFKLTTPADAELAEALLAARQSPGPSRQTRNVDEDEDDLF